jgi:RNA polymerase sigma factor (sigma-70 family)
VNPDDKSRRFQEAFLPHLSAAYNLARWLVRNDHDADDIVQEAYLRAFRFFDGFRGGDGRAWLLTIVRKRCYSWLRKSAPEENLTVFDEQQHSTESHEAIFAGTRPTNPEVLLSWVDDAARLNRALENLPKEFREALVLRELEELSYKQIASIMGVPLGTIMSRIARGRKLLMRRLQCPQKKK